MTETWTKVWARGFTREENLTVIEREVKSVRWRKIKAKILSQYGSFSGLNVIEVGSGRGIYGLLTAREGCRVTLLDNNEFALEKAHELFSDWDQNFEGIQADAFDLPTHLIGKFDIAMSYGLAEHFRYPERLQIFESHKKLLKPGGLLIASIPNALFFPYRIGKFLLEAMDKWRLGLEIPFSRRELIHIGNKLGLKDHKVFGSGFAGDSLNFWLTQRLIHLAPFLWDKFRTAKKVTPLKERSSYFSFDPESWLDDYLGYALVLVGGI